MYPGKYAYDLRRCYQFRTRHGRRVCRGVAVFELFATHLGHRMGFKRKRQGSPRGLPAGQRLRRDIKAADDWSAWGWVGTEITDASNLTSKHILTCCGLSGAHAGQFCGNKYTRNTPQTGEPGALAEDSDDDIIVVSDDNDPDCFRKNKNCKRNPFCLNNLGQEKWERESTLMVLCSWTKA